MSVNYIPDFWYPQDDDLTGLEFSRLLGKNSKPIG